MMRGGASPRPAAASRTRVRDSLGARRPLVGGTLLSGWAARGLAVLVLAGALALPWLVTWQGVLRRPEPARVVQAPMLVQYRPELVRVPEGRFKMGSPTAEREKFRKGLPAALYINFDEEHEHDAEVAQLYVCRTEITLGQWRAVMDSSPNDCTHGCNDDHPVTNVNWHDACRYMVELTRRENEIQRLHGEPELTACYTWTGATCEWTDRACTGYRLPTETEWEYFARAGTRTAYWYGDDLKDMCKHGNGADQTEKRERPDRDKPEKYGPMLDCDDGHANLAPTGRYTENPWGLFDVHGNVAEWVWDWSVDEPGSGVQGYAGPSFGEYRIARGGSFWVWPGRLRAANRTKVRPSNRLPDLGLRCVRGAPQP